MSRRVIFTASFVVFVAAIIWVVSASVRLPESSFAAAAKITDHKVRVSVPTKVVKPESIVADGSIVRFTAVDRNGTESKVLYEHANALTASQLAGAGQKGSEISLVGHVCGGEFKASDLRLPAY